MSLGNAALDAGFWQDPARVDLELREMLESVHTIAVLGAKANAESPCDAQRIPTYLQGVGYEVVGVNPRLREPAPFGVAATLAGVDGRIDCVNVFRAPEHLPAHIGEILALPDRPQVVWFQLGIFCGQSAARLRAAGIRVVQDRCVMVEHRRLLGRSEAS